jgi:hypothetical protein
MIMKKAIVAVLLAVSVLTGGLLAAKAAGLFCQAGAACCVVGAACCK